MIFNKSRKLKNSKKGMELALNFIVIIILTIVVFTMGLYFAVTSFSKTEMITQDTLGQLGDQLEDLACNDKEAVCVGIAKKTVKRGDLAVFGLQIANRIGNDEVFTFTITPKGYVLDSAPDQNIDGDDGTVAVVYQRDATTIKANDLKKFPIGIQATKESKYDATYIFDVKVFSGTTSSAYPGANNIQKLYLRVEP